MGIIVSDKEFCNRDTTRIYNDDGSCATITHCESVYITEEIPCDDTVYMDIGFALHKAKPAEQLVSGWANVAINADGSIPLDWQDDVIRPETLEKAAIKFMLEYRESGEMHNNLDAVGTIVESIVFTKEKQEALGIPEGCVPQGWFITVKVHDSDVFAKVVDGTYKMFSIQGTGRRIKV